MNDDKIFLNLGCGPVQPKGWINVDGSRRCWLAKYLGFFDRALVKFRLLPPTEFNKNIFYQNLNKKLKFKSNFADAVYGGEILEHFTYEEGQSFLRECYRVLKKGGIIRMCVPDNYVFWKNYITLYEELKKLKTSERTEGDIIRYVKMFFKPIRLSFKFYQSNFGHKWSYDELSLKLQLRKAGFTNPKRKKFHESEIPDIDKVEQSDYLIMEAIKPKNSRFS